MSSPSLNLCQQAFLLSYESNSLHTQKGTSDDLARRLHIQLEDFFARPATRSALGGQWSLVWGPAVYEHQEGAESAPDNVMYVAASPDQSVCVVAVAGTNEDSPYDMNQEDNAVTVPVSWTAAFPSLPKYGVPWGIFFPKLSQGTARGVNNLLIMRDPRTHQSLVDFLDTLGAKESKTLIFAGHSLGGALAPTLALALFNPSGGKYSTRNWGHVYVLPTAGATPGNEAFSSFFREVFPAVSLNLSQSYYAWNQVIWNSLDVVPHAWAIPMLQEAPNLYSPLIMPDAVIQMALADALFKSSLFTLNSGTKYTQLPNIQVQGVLNRDPRFGSFTTQLGYQHIEAYEHLYGVQDLVSDKARSGLRLAVQKHLATLQRMADRKVDSATAEHLIEHLRRRVHKSA